MSQLERLLERARIAEACDRFDDMLASMKTAALIDPSDPAVRGLLSVAYKNLINDRRQPWRSLPSEGPSIVQDLRNRLALELEDVCKDCFALIDQILPTCTNDVDSQVFYLKMKGDYCRYLQECKPSGAVLTQANEAYSRATQLGEALPVVSALRLGLSLNYSVFVYETCGERDKGYNLARTTLNSIGGGAQNYDEEAENILSLLHENYMAWKDQLGLSHNQPEQQQELEVEDM